MAETDSRYFEFGEFQMDAHRRVLRRNGESVHLTPRAFDLLSVMVQNAGRVLEHDELLDKVWPDAFVEQGNLKKTISTLRRALGESPESNEFIVTVPRRGYRFSPGVKELPADAILIRETKGEILIEEEIDDELPALKPVTQIEGRTSSRFPPVFLAAGAVLALVLAAWAAWPYLRPKPQRFSAENVTISRLMSEGNVANGAISADGNYMVFSVSKGGERSLWVRQVAMESGVQIVPPANVFFWDAAFAPDSSLIYFTIFSDVDPGKNGFYRIPVMGGTPQLITKEILLGTKFSPDGKRLAAYYVARSDGKERHDLITMNPDGSDKKVIAASPEDSLYLGIAWSHDGGNILYGMKRHPTTEKPVYYAAQLPAMGGEARIMMPEQEKIRYVEDWLPDGKSFLMRQREPQSEQFQVWQYFPASGETVRVTNDEYNYSGLAAARDGKTLAAFRNIGLASIWVSEDPKVGGFRQIVSGLNSPYLTDWTSDGQIVFSVVENSREFVSIMNADGSQKRQLTDGSDGIFLYPRVGGDGKTIIFISNRGGSRDTWRVDVDGQGLAQMTSGAGVGDCVLLADAQTLVYAAYVPSKSMWTLFKRSAGGGVEQLLETDVHAWDVSTDEKFLAVYTPDENGKRRLVIRHLAGGAIKSFDVEDISDLRWSRDGSAINYVRVRDDNTSEVVNLPVNGEPESLVTAVSGEGIGHFSWSHDGKKLAVSRGRMSSEAVLIKASPTN